GQLVHETFHDEHIVRGTDAAPPRRWDAGWLLANIFDQNVWACIRRSRSAFHGILIQTVLEVFRVPSRRYGGSRDVMSPGDRHTGCTQPDGERVAVVRPVHVALNIGLPGPDHLHRAIDLSSDSYRERDAVDLQATAETAA